MYRLFARLLKKTAKRVVVPQIPDGQRVYCIGDIHGRLDLLLQLHEMILADSSQYPGQKTAVYLGDYIDRGEHSSQVIDVLQNQSLPGFEFVFLLGNHEQAMMDFIDQPQTIASWLNFGGRETLSSYGVELNHIPHLYELPQLAEQLDQNLPDTHRTFLHNCVSQWRCGGYYFVHAGIRPGVALNRQSLEDQLWIRGEFLLSDQDHGAVVVHGHNISAPLAAPVGRSP